MVQAAFCLYLVHTPSILSGNRLPTLTKYRRFVDTHPQWRELDGSRQAIVHVDWPATISTLANTQPLSSARSDFFL